MVRSLYKIAEMKVDLCITFEPRNSFKHMRGHFGVIF